MNDNKYKNATILLCGENFGCGSSRESAPAAIAELGIRCLIGSSFGDIFFNNSFQQSILPIVLDLKTIRTILKNGKGRIKKNARGPIHCWLRLRYDWGWV
jgi:3-isopropylmalate dehydratase small subunit